MNNIGQARILQQARNMQKDPSPILHALPLQSDIYIWHFTILGPPQTDFHQGIYHGQILLPFQYPFKPPDIVFMNNNGRFEVNTKICLTITQYHPEQWNSAWTIRTMLQAVISLFNQHINGIGYVQSTPENRRHFAKKSQTFKCQKCGPLKNIIKPREPFHGKIKEMKTSVTPKNTNSNQSLYQYRQPNQQKKVSESKITQKFKLNQNQGNSTKEFIQKEVNISQQRKFKEKDKQRHYRPQKNSQSKVEYYTKQTYPFNKLKVLQNKEKDIYSPQYRRANEQQFLDSKMKSMFYYRHSNPIVGARLVQRDWLAYEIAMSTMKVYTCEQIDRNKFYQFEK